MIVICISLSLSLQPCIIVKLAGIFCLIRITCKIIKVVPPYVLLFSILIFKAIPVTVVRMNNKYIYDICTPLKENVNYYFYLLMLFSFYNNINLSIRLFIINYYFIDLFKIRPESNYRS